MGLTFPFPFIDVLTLPTDASTGRRIVIDGVNGLILFYDSTNDLRIRMGEEAFIEFSSGDTGEEARGTIGSALASGFPSDTLVTTIQSPGFDQLSSQADLSLWSWSRDGTSVSPDIRTSFGFGDGSGSSDFVALGRGMFAKEILNANSSGFTGDSVTDMNLDNVQVFQDRTYEIHLHTMVQVTGAAGEWALLARVNGTSIGRLGYIDLAAGERMLVDGTVIWNAPATAQTDDIDVFADEISGTSTLTLEANATIPRTLTLKDVGSVL